MTPVNETSTVLRDARTPTSHDARGGDRVPVLRRGARTSSASIRTLHRVPRRPLHPCRGRSPSPTTPAPTAPGRSPRRLADELDRRAGAAPRREGPRAGAAHRVDGERRAGSSPTWTSTSRPTSTRCSRSSRRCSRATATSPSAPGSRRAPRVVRGPKRELISRGYNLLLRTTLRAGFSDAQCGFKAHARRRRARAAPAGRGRGLVLRHRAARARRAQRPAHPRGAGRLGRRPGLPRRHRAHRRRRPPRRVAHAAALRARRRRRSTRGTRPPRPVDPTGSGTRSCGSRRSAW